VTTLAGLVAETKRHLGSMHREPMNKLASSATAGDPTLLFSYDLDGIQAGAYLQVGLEVVYVWQVDASTKTATVERAQQGSVASPHAINSVVTVNPRFPDFAIVKAINDDLADLSTPVNGLYRIVTTQLTSSTVSAGYDLTGATDVLEVLSVTARHSGQPRTWLPVTNYTLNRIDHSDFASGFALQILDAPTSGQPIRVTYKAPFAPLVNLTDDVQIVAGLPSSMQDIPPMGAAVRLVAPREISRNFTDSQGDSRRAEEVPPGAVAASMRGLAALRQSRVNAEAGRLAVQWPERSFLPLPLETW
jgi:hypothetical protein